MPINVEQIGLLITVDDFDELKHLFETNEFLTDVEVKDVEQLTSILKIVVGGKVVLNLQPWNYTRELVGDELDQ